MTKRKSFLLNPERRRLIIDSYLRTNAEVLPKEKRIREALGKEIKISVVVPTYCEEKAILHLLKALARQTYRQFEVIIVDNGSHDRTVRVVLNLCAQLDYALYILREEKPGAGNARKTGMDEVVRRVRERDNKKILHHFIAITDADVIPPPYWLEEIVKTFNNLPAQVGLISGTHGGSKYIDEIIKDKLGLPNYFNRAANLTAFLQRNNIGQVKIRGPNSAFEIESYAAVGGFKQPLDAKDRVLPDECAELGAIVRKKGYPIHHLDVTVEISQRRHLFELISGVDSYSLWADSGDRFLAIRKDETFLLKKALRRIPRNGWISYQKQILESVVKNTILNPLLSGESEIDSLRKVFNENQVGKLLEDIKRMPELEIIKKWTDIFIEFSEAIMRKGNRQNSS